MRVLTESQRHGAVHRTAEGAINLGQLQAADRGVQSGLPPLRASGDDMPAASVAEPPFGQAEGDLPAALMGIVDINQRLSRLAGAVSRPSCRRRSRRPHSRA